jgi:hypothetical protein
MIKICYLIRIPEFPFYINAFPNNVNTTVNLQIVLRADINNSFAIHYHYDEF